jgi:AcrR family transcriptional regulator
MTSSVPDVPDPAPRERLLAAAVDYAGEHGIVDVSLRTLAAAIGTSHRMLIHHFGSKAGLLAAIVAEVERRQRVALAADEPPVDASLIELGRQGWQRVADPALWPYERLFFELYAQALRDPDSPLAPTGDLIEPWLDQLVPLYERRGLSTRQARAAARLGIAVTRGLLLDLLATQDRAGVDDAMEAFLEMAGRAESGSPD